MEEPDPREIRKKTMAENFVLDEGVQALRSTPAVLRALLSDLPESWLTSNEGPESWNPIEVVGHLIHGEETDWIPRVEHILKGPANVPFEPFDRSAHLSKYLGRPLFNLLDEFETLRIKSLSTLASFNLKEADLGQEGVHPAFGRVTLRQLLATWVCHDFSHIGQIARVLAKRHREAVGPWAQYLSILHR